jgi:AraC family transcriptional regulator
MVARPFPEVTSHSQRAGEDVLVDTTTGALFPAAPTGSLLLSSVPLGWRGIIVEWHRLPPRELSQHYVVGHGISVNTGARPITFGWNGRNGWRDNVINPGESHLLTQGELNTPRWLQTFDEISIVLQPCFVADVVRDGLAADRIEFSSQRSVADSVIARYARSFYLELAADVPKGRLYAETLTIGLVLHLLAHYGVAKPKAPAPRGKFNAFQLRSVVDFVDAHLSEDVSLMALAQQAHVSPFHFARLFRRTVGVPPHQFVLQLRLQRALGLMKTRTLSLAHIAVECGFHDQPHLTRTFRKVLGTTPATHPLAARAD